MNLILFIFWSGQKGDVKIELGMAWQCRTATGELYSQPMVTPQDRTVLRGSDFVCVKFINVMDSLGTAKSSSGSKNDSFLFFFVCQRNLIFGGQE
jgi:hypothetical protein